MVKVNSSNDQIVIEIPKNFIKEALENGTSSLNIKLNLNENDQLQALINEDVTELSEDSGIKRLSSRL